MVSGTALQVTLYNTVLVLVATVKYLRVGTVV